MISVCLALIPPKIFKEFELERVATSNGTEISSLKELDKLDLPGEGFFVLESPFPVRESSLNELFLEF